MQGTTWSLTLREEHRLMMFEYRVLGGIFGPKKEEVTGTLRKLPNKDFHNSYSAPNIIRMIKLRWMRWAEHEACIRKIINAYKVLVRKPEG
jgi:hypothetical protein